MYIDWLEKGNFFIFGLSVPAPSNWGITEFWPKVISFHKYLIRRQTELIGRTGAILVRIERNKWISDVEKHGLNGLPGWYSALTRRRSTDWNASAFIDNTTLEIRLKIYQHSIVYTHYQDERVHLNENHDSYI